MSRRGAMWLAWSLWALCVMLITLIWVLDVLTPPIPEREELPLGFAVILTIGLLVYPTLGALVASRHPHNPIGWVFCATSFVVAGQGFAGSYADYALVVRHGELAGVKIMAWFSSWIGEPSLLLSLALLFLLVPNGRLPSSRWRPVLWSVISASASLYLVSALTPGPLLPYESIDNPIGIGGAVGDILGMLGTVAIVVLLVACLASAISLILRLRREVARSVSSSSGSYILPP